MKYKVKSVGLKHIDWVGLSLNTELPSISKMIIMYLERFMNKDQHVAWPSQTRMMSELSLSKGALNKHLNILENEKWITRERGDSKNNTKYFISFPEVIENAVKKVDGSTRGGLGSIPDELRSIRGELEVVHEVDTNSKLNSKTNSKGRFTPPTLEEVEQYINEKGYRIDAKAFINHYGSTNWYRGRTKIKNWHMCIATWVKSGEEKQNAWDGAI